MGLAVCRFWQQFLRCVMAIPWGAVGLAVVAAAAACVSEECLVCDLPCWLMWCVRRRRQAARRRRKRKLGPRRSPRSPSSGVSLVPCGAGASVHAIHPLAYSRSTVNCHPINDPQNLTERAVTRATSKSLLRHVARGVCAGCRGRLRTELHSHP